MDEFWKQFWRHPCLLPDWFPLQAVLWFIEHLFHDLYIRKYILCITHLSLVGNIFTLIAFWDVRCESIGGTPGVLYRISILAFTYFILVFLNWRCPYLLMFLSFKCFLIFPVSQSCDSYNLTCHIVFNNHISVFIDNEGICPKPSTQTHAQKFGFVFIYRWLKSVAAFTPGNKIRFMRRPYWNWIVLLPMKLQTWINTEDWLWSHLSSEGGKGCNVTALNTSKRNLGVDT